MNVLALGDLASPLDVVCLSPRAQNQNGSLPEERVAARQCSPPSTLSEQERVVGVLAILRRPTTGVRQVGD
jgi:hypothetical protein